MKGSYTAAVRPEDGGSDLDFTPLERSNFDPEDIDRAVVSSSPGAWFEVYGRIIDKAKRLVPPKANALQKRVFEVVIWCIKNRVPIRLILLKPRQKGCSTVSMGVLYWLMNLFDNFRSVVIGHEYSQTDNLWQIFRNYSINDVYDWGFGRRVLKAVCEFANGSALEKETAGDAEAGRSGTFHGVVGTEVARWREAGVANAEDILNGLLNCVPYLPDTFVVLESTARGASGPFYETWNDALDFEEYKRRFERGETLDGSYIRVFAGWYEFEDSCDELTVEQSAHVQDTITPVETEIIQKYGLDYGHIAWRRRTIRVECQRDEQKFDREYPETPDHAFRASAPSFFNTKGMSVLRSEAATQKEEWGYFDAVGSNITKTHRNFTWTPLERLDPAAQCIMIEKPVVGLRYLLAVDTMGGEVADDDGQDLDHHAALVIREGYYDADRGWKPDKVVCRTVLSPKKPDNVNCRWLIDILEECVWRMAQYYGDCMIVVESNMDRGLIQALKKRGAVQYESMTHEVRGDIRKSKKSGKLGYRTTGGQADGTRSYIIDNLASAVREYDRDGDGISVDRRTVQEMMNFVVGKNGKIEAITGEHDDSVMALAIGKALIRHGTKYKMRTARPPLPSDLRKIDKRRKVRGQYL